MSPTFFLPLKNVRPRSVRWAPLLLVFVALGCEDDPAAPPAPDTTTGAWVEYTPFEWTHDGRPYESTYITVYSDAASDEMKQQVAQIADERFAQIMTLFDFDDIADFIYPPGYSKLEIYINRTHSENINWAYWNGFIFTIRSPEITGHWLNYTVYTVRHELLHNFEFLIEGREVLGTEFWFKEGIATHVGCLEDTGWDTIRDLSELEAWIGQNETVPGGGNPIKIREASDFPPGADWHEYYRVFELVVTYVLDEEGMGRSYQDVLNLFYDLRDGVSFPVSFESHFGIAVSDLEAEVFDRLRAYLSGSRPVPVAVHRGSSVTLGRSVTLDGSSS
jgi:hypothetical protein